MSCMALGAPVALTLDENLHISLRHVDTWQSFICAIWVVNIWACSSQLFCWDGNPSWYLGLGSCSGSTLVERALTRHSCDFGSRDGSSTISCVETASSSYRQRVCMFVWVNSVCCVSQLAFWACLTFHWLVIECRVWQIFQQCIVVKCICSDRLGSCLT